MSSLRQRKGGSSDNGVASASSTDRSSSPASSDTSPSSADAVEAKKQDDEVNDWPSILLLLLLYTLQGIPMGLSSSIPFILQEKVGYGDQATFSLVSWPFSLKLLWAPFVDSLYSERFGRRKSWLIPVQFICAALMVVGSWFMNDLLGEGEGQTPHVIYLTVFFFVLYFMMATQDIAVDGWAITMLSEKNVGHASTCNTVGQTVGYFVAYVGFLALNDPATCNSYLRTEPEDEGLVSLPGFMSFWGWIMFFTTLGVWLFKHEKPEDHGSERLTIAQTYKEMYSVMRLPSVISLSVVLLTSKIGFAAAESVASLKLVEYGMKKEKLALLTPILIPLGIIIPVMIGRYIKPTQPLNLFLWGYPVRLVVGLLYAGIVYITPMAMAQDESSHFVFYAIILAVGALHELAANMMYVPQMAFYARISDPSIGGTYMTFLNTVTNLGSKWPNSLSLAVVDHLTTRECLGGYFHDEVLAIGSRTCSDAVEREICTEAGGECLIVRDGFYVETVICLVIGFAWFLFFFRRIQYLQNLKIDKWRVNATAD
ncbi:Major facilitator super domain-containing protein 3 [Phytophthora boehmeriae]|uniref:Major facilitator super domain-containing protein 3 n=1 Tax=Phytophthora boehmeriae TaxID=109152 RepID=A0A8T1X0I3_9STRA|nr:Major facilitator super domain-containing protein 3 [Phytophthora boehmeriae]